MKTPSRKITIPAAKIKRLTQLANIKHQFNGCFTWGANNRSGHKILVSGNDFQEKSRVVFVFE